MEYWKNGIMGFNWFEELVFPDIPIFQHSMQVIL